MNQLFLYLSLSRTIMLLLLAICITFLPSTVLSQKTWVGISGDWNVGSNWSGGTVPSITDSVVIGGFIDVTIPAGTSARAKSLYIGSKIDLDIEATGRLNFKEGARGINNLGTITCSGTINVRKPLAEAIINDSLGTITITSSGVVNIDTSGADAIVNNGIFTNSGLVEVDSSAENGITNNATATLINHGSIELTDLSVFGLYNYGIFDNETQGSLSISNTGSNGMYGLANNNTQNNGHISIVNNGGHGLHNSGIFTNTNSIMVDAAAGNGVSNGGVFHNELLGSITISNIAGDGVINATGDTIQNNGSISVIHVGDHGISNGGFFTNANSIVIDSIDEQGVYNFGIFHNEARGSLAITNTTYEGIINAIDDVFQNNGQISISNSTEEGILNLGIFTNTNVINIDGVGDDGIQNSRILSNEVQGNIIISNAGLSGLYIDNALDSVINNGQIHISQVQEYGLYNLGDLVNTNSIVIDSAGKNGIHNFKSITNEVQGIISVVNAEVHGIYSYTNGTIQNNGLIDVSNSSDGIANLGNFINAKIITMDTLGDHGFGNLGTFTNEEQGSLSISNAGINGMYNNPSSNIQNNGIISILTSGGGIISYGTITNSNSITIDFVDSYGLSLGLNATYTNEANSLLHILGASGAPLEVDTGAVFDGLGEIIIED